MSAESASEVTVVWCDYGGVMTPPVHEATSRIEEHYGLPWARIAAAADAVATEHNLRGMGPLERGLMSQLEWGRRIAAHLGDAAPANAFADFADEWNRGREPETELLDELDRIRVAGVRVGMLTNSVAEWEPYRRVLLGEHAFDAALRSHETGLAKPDAAIWSRADELLPPAGGTVVFVDDFAVNCEAAALHGWVPVHHVAAGMTVARLRALVPA